MGLRWVDVSPSPKSQAQSLITAAPAASLTSANVTNMGAGPLRGDAAKAAVTLLVAVVSTSI